MGDNYEVKRLLEIEDGYSVNSTYNSGKFIMIWNVDINTSF